MSEFSSKEGISIITFKNLVSAIARLGIIINYILCRESTTYLDIKGEIANYQGVRHTGYRLIVLI